MPEESDEDVKRRFYKTLADYYSVRVEHTGFLTAVGQIRDHMGTLNENLRKASESSDKLTAALNKITFAGVVVSVFALLVAFLTLAFEIFKYFDSR